MNKHLAFVLLAMLYPFFKLMYLNTMASAWLMRQLMKPMSKLFYHTYGEKLKYEDSDWN
jgi:hypothetical protein